MIGLLLTTGIGVASELHACAAPAEAKFDAANPEPALEFIPAGPDAPEWLEEEVDRFRV